LKYSKGSRILVVVVAFLAVMSLFTKAQKFTPKSV
jgi:hypothetical protein